MRKIFGLCVLALLVAFLPVGAASAQLAPTGDPNILFVLTDDQQASTLSHMPAVQRELVAGGKTFENAIYTYPLCCPSRATILTGKYAHNTQVLGNGPPLGGYPKFRNKGLNQSTTATWLDAVGYDTAYFGKYMNGYKRKEAEPGWDTWMAYAGADTKMGWDAFSTGSRNKRETNPVRGEQQIADRALSWVERERTQPFFGVVAFGAPHSPFPHPKETDRLFREIQTPRTPSFNEADVSDKPTEIRRLKSFDHRRIKAIDSKYRNALRSLVNVDRFVSDVMSVVPENTYVIFWTDNGTHTGYHRMSYGKNTPYEEDINFPLIVRGPGVEAGGTTTKLVGNHDIAPTIAVLAGVEPHGGADSVDGRSFAPLLGAAEPDHWRSALLTFSTAGQHGNNGWEAVRTEDETYVERETGERELYDLGSDPYELENLLGVPDPSTEAEAVASELSGRLDALRGCAGEGCRAAEGQ